MTPKQKRFCELYLTKYYGNATQSAIHAGYSKKTAYSQGQRLLKNVEIIKYMSKLKAELLEEMKNDHYNTIKNLRALANFNIQDLYDEKSNLKLIKDLPSEVAYAISSTETIIKKDGEEWDIITSMKTESKLKALETMSKIQKLYEDIAPVNQSFTIIVGKDG